MLAKREGNNKIRKLVFSGINPVLIPKSKK